MHTNNTDDIEVWTKKLLDVGKIMIATPTYDRKVCVDYMVSLLKTMNRLTETGLFADVSLIGGDAFLDKARNCLVQSFLNGDYQTLSFIDSDQGWDAEAFLRMCLYSQEIVVGVPPKRTDDLTKAWSHLSLFVDKDNQCNVVDGLIEVTMAGSGFMRIKRSAITKMLNHYPERARVSDGGPHDGKSIPWLFNADVRWDKKHNGEPPIGDFCGEDVGFLHKWFKLGEKVWLDPQQTFSHIGPKTWTGNFYEYLKSHHNVQTREDVIIRGGTKGELYGQTQKTA